MYLMTLLIGLGLLIGAGAEAGITRGLPQGVRTFVYRYLTAGEIGNFDANGNASDLSINETIPITAVSDYSSPIKRGAMEVDSLDPTLVKELSLGQIVLNPEINAHAHGMALGYGISERLTVAASVAVVNAAVNVKGSFQPSDSIQKASARLHRIAAEDPFGGEKASAIAQILDQIPEVRAENIQAVLTNDLGYEPVGSWSARGLSDLQLFAHYKFYDQSWSAHAVRSGVEVPTGRTDDPDILTDFGFGDGYWSTFVQSLNDFYPFKDPRYAATLKFSYQLNIPDTKTVRLYSRSDLPLSARKESVKMNPGDEWSAAPGVSTAVWGGLSFSGAYVFSGKFSDGYEGSDPNYRYGILAEGSSEYLETLELALSFSTADFYLQKRFPIPFEVTAAYSKAMRGLNARNVEVASLQLQLYF